MACFSFFFLIMVTTLSSCHVPTTAHLNPTFHLSRGISSNWTNNDDSIPTTMNFTDGSLARFILLRPTEVNATSQRGFGFGFCFYCSPADTCYLAIIFVEMCGEQILTIPPEVVWSANRDKPVGENAILCFSASKSLALFDAKTTNTTTSSPVWQAKRTSVLVSAMSVTKMGNFVILSTAGFIVWQSFDHLTDTLLSGQTLRRGQRLTSRISAKNLSSGLFHVFLNYNSLSAYVEADNRPSRYLSVSTFSTAPLISIEFTKGYLTLFYVIWYLIFPAFEFTNESTSVVQILRLDHDGGLRIHGWEAGKEWEEVFAFTDSSDECRFPLECGRYGVCDGGNCTCPVAVDGKRYFEHVDIGSPRLGCSHIHVEDTSEDYELIDFGNLSYYIYFDESQAIPELEDKRSCVESCKRNMSCQAAFFKHDKSSPRGYCFLVTDVLSMTKTSNSSSYYSSVHLKIRVSSPPKNPPTSSASHSSLVLVALSASIALVLVILIVTIAAMLVLQKKKVDEWSNYGFLKQVSVEAPKRFSCRELCIATKKFSVVLGQGGFGTVFKGVLKDGTVVAVKHFDTMRGTKEFLAEVEAIGNTHHIHLVRLIGFCVKKKHRMLVYEYMSKGSLDKWIFCENPETSLDWNTRKKIVIDVAKGLMYLHEQCRHKIAHLDVKPHNILLDENFNAKISDFGLSKLINRDESQIVTGARGTLGYLAPEWENSRITVKADVYSFGILLLEIITGRKILDCSQPNSDGHLRSLLRKKAIENRLKDMVDCQSEDMKNHVEEAIDMIKLGMWCSDSDYNKRPSMSLVVKTLEDGTNAAGIDKQRLDDIASSL